MCVCVVHLCALVKEAHLSAKVSTYISGNSAGFRNKRPPICCQGPDRLSICVTWQMIVSGQVRAHVCVCVWAWVRKIGRQVCASMQVNVCRFFVCVRPLPASDLCSGPCSLPVGNDVPGVCCSTEASSRLSYCMLLMTSWSHAGPLSCQKHSSSHHRQISSDLVRSPSLSLLCTLAAPHIKVSTFRFKLYNCYCSSVFQQE